MHRFASRVVSSLFVLTLVASVDALAGGSLPVVEDNSGAFTYRLPLDVPPGPGGATPDLALLYSSAGGAGNAGFGWTLPYSSVRLDLKWGVPSWWAPDDVSGVCDPGQFAGRLYVDDMELVPQEVDPLHPSGTCLFRTRPDTFAVVVPIFGHATGEVLQTGMPTGLAVVRQDGTVWWYGDPDGDSVTGRVLAPRPDGGALTVQWLLRHVQDRDGNLVSFHPDRDPERFEPLAGRDLAPRPPENVGACDGCLRAVTWARLDRSDALHWDDQEPGMPTGYGAGGGVTGRFDDFLADPASFWPTPHPHYYAAIVDWEPRPDVRTSFITGRARVRDRRVRQVTVAAAATVWRSPDDVVQIDDQHAEYVRSWRLDYDAGTTGRSRLVRVWTFPGEYDPTALYAHHGVPADGSEAWEPEASTDPWLLNPWEFVYSDSSVLDPTTFSYDLGAPQAVVPDAVTEMEFAGPAWEAQPWLGATWNEGGFPTITTQDWNGDGLVDLVQHDPQLPRYPVFEASVLEVLMPWNDMSPNDDNALHANNDAADASFWVRFNQGDGFTELQPTALDPFAVQPVGDFIPDLADYPDLAEAELPTPLEASPDGLVVSVLSEPDDEVALARAEELAWGLYPEDDPWSPTLRDVVIEELMSLRADGPAADIESTVGLYDEAWPPGENGGLCAFWWTGLPNLLAWLGTPPPVDPMYASWCEHRSCAPFCEVGTTVTAGVGRRIAGQLASTSAVPEDVLTLEITKPSGSGPQAGDLTLWRRYALTRSATGHWLATASDIHGTDLILGGLEPRSKARWVDGFARASFQTRVRSSQLERLRTAGEPLDSHGLKDAFTGSLHRPATVQDGLVHDTIDIDGDGYADRVLGGAAVLSSSLTLDEAIWNKDVEADKEQVVSTAHMPWFVSRFDPVAGEFGPVEVWRMQLDHPWLMGGAASFPDPACEVVDQNDPRLFAEDHGFSFLGIWEGTSEASTSPVQSRASVTIGASGPAAGASLSLGVVNLSVSMTANGPSWGVGIGPASFGVHGMQIGPVTFDYSGSVTASAASVILFVITKALETFDIPYGAGVGISSSGVSFEVPGVGGDTTDIPASIRWQRQGLVDLTGDGRPDYVIAHNPGWNEGLSDTEVQDPATSPVRSDELDWVVLVNEGDGWSDPVAWPGVHTQYLSAVRNDAYRRNGLSESGPGVNSDLGYRRGHEVAGLRDLNGDGLVDFVYAGLRDSDGGCLAPAWDPYDPESGAFAWAWARKKSSLDSVTGRVTLCVQLNTGASFDEPVDWFPLGSPSTVIANPTSGEGVHVPRMQQFVALSSTRVRFQQSEAYNDQWGRGVSGLEDFNGDGLLDWWMIDDLWEPHGLEDGHPRVFFNTGTGFDTRHEMADGHRYGAVRYEASSVAAYQAQPSASPDFSGQRAQVQLDRNRTFVRPGGAYVQTARLDIDGDGTLDWVQSHVNEAGGSHIYAFPLQDAVPDQLLRVWSPSGGLTDVAYAPARDFMDLPGAPAGDALPDGTVLSDGVPDIYPASAQVVTSRTVRDGLGPRGAPPQTVDYRYADPHNHRADDLDRPSFWRRPLGFGTVVAEDAEATAWADYHTTLLRAGLTASSGLMTADGEPISHVETTWDASRFASNYPGLADPGLNWHFAEAGTMSMTWEPGSSDVLMAHRWLEHDVRNGLVTCAQADPDGDGDVDLLEVSEYDDALLLDGRMDAVNGSTIATPGPNTPPGGALCDPRSDALANGPAVRRTLTEFFETGRPASVTTVDATTGDALSVDYDYTSHGNPTMVRDPASAEAWTLYDPVIGVYPLTSIAPPNTDVSPPVEHVSRAEVCGFGAPDWACDPPSLGLHSAHGQVAHAVDPSGAEVWTMFDPLGRTFAIGDSVAAASGAGPTITAVERSVRRDPVDLYLAADEPLPVGGLPAMAAVSAPFDDPAAPSSRRTNSYAFVDGLGRTVLQRESWIDDTGKPGQRVNGYAELDVRGRPVLAQHACFSTDVWDDPSDFDALSPATPGALCADPPAVEAFEYDAVDRVVRHDRPDGGYLLQDYAIDSGLGGGSTETRLFDPSLGLLQHTRVVAAPFELQTTRYDAVTSQHDSFTAPLPGGLVAGPSELVTIERFDALGRRTEVERTPLPGPKTLFEWDGLDRLVFYEDPDQGRWSFGYDGAGRLAERARVGRFGLVEDGTGWTYDTHGRVLTEARYDDGLAWLNDSPDAWWSWEYDTGDLLEDPNAPATAAATALGPVGRASLAMHTEADACGDGVDAVDVVLTWRHDLRGQVVEEGQALSSCEWPVPEVPEALYTHHGYANGGARTWTRRPLSGESVRTALDDVGRASALYEAKETGAWSFSAPMTQYVADATWEIRGRPSTLQYGNGVEHGFEYETGTDATGALQRVELVGPSGVLLDRLYDWDSAGNLSGWSDVATSGPSGLWSAPAEEWGCTYDGIGSLLGCSTVGPDKTSFSYAYDAAGNLVWEQSYGPTGSREASQYVANGAPLALTPGYRAPLNAPVARLEVDTTRPTAERAQSFEYDSRGHLVAQRYHDPSGVLSSSTAEVSERGLADGSAPLPPVAERRYDWDATGRLRSVSVAPANAGVPGPLEETSFYRYDAGGSRIESIYIPATGALADAEPVRVRRFAGVVTTERSTSGTDGTFTYGFAGLAVAQRDMGPADLNPGGPYDEVRWLAGDHLGSATIVTDAAGELLRGVRYEPYGRIRAEWGPESDQPDYTPGAVEDLFNNKPRTRRAFGLDGLGFELEGYDYGARVYLPELSRWASADSITPDAVWEANPFAYVRNNPLKYVDPTGHAAETPLDIGFFILDLVLLSLDPTWANAGFATWSGVSIFVPIVPGSYAGRGGVFIAQHGDEVVDGGRMVVGLGDEMLDSTLSWWASEGAQGTKALGDYGVSVVEDYWARMLTGAERHHPIFRYLIRAMEKAGVKVVRTPGGRMRPQTLVDMPAGWHQEMHRAFDALHPDLSRRVFEEGVNPVDEIARMLKDGEITPGELLDRLEGFQAVFLKDYPEALEQVRRSIESYRRRTDL